MPNDNCQKVKLLKIMEMLRQDSDENNPISTQQICRHLAAMGISCDRRTLKKDFDALRSQGYEILDTQSGHQKAYYVMDRSFSVPELKILIDAVQAASFITKDKTDELISKLAALGGSHQAEILKGNIVCFNTRKHSNESIYYTVGYLEEALLRKRKASFFYFDLDENRQRVYRKNMKRYVVDPMALVFYEDNYYLMCWSEKYNDVVNYRVDRMEAVTVEEEPVCETAILLEDNVSQYTEQVFKMYNGEKVEVELRFTEDLIGAVYDKFGEETQLTWLDDGTLSATVDVQISPTFWGWVFQFENKMRILSPDSVVVAYKSIAEEASK